MPRCQYGQGRGLLQGPPSGRAQAQRQSKGQGGQMEGGFQKDQKGFGKSRSDQGCAKGPKQFCCFMHRCYTLCVCVCAQQMPKEHTDETLRILKSTPLTNAINDREMAILATAIVEIGQKFAIDALEIPLVIQVEPCRNKLHTSHRVSCFWVSGSRSGPEFWPVAVRSDQSPHHDLHRPQRKICADNEMAGPGRPGLFLFATWGLSGANFVDRATPPGARGASGSGRERLL